MRFIDWIFQEDPEPEPEPPAPVPQAVPDEPSSNVVLTGLRLDFSDVFLLVLMISVAQALLFGFFAFILYEIGVF